MISSIRSHWQRATARAHVATSYSIILLSYQYFTHNRVSLLRSFLRDLLHVVDGSYNILKHHICNSEKTSNDHQQSSYRLLLPYSFVEEGVLLSDSSQVP